MNLTNCVTAQNKFFNKDTRKESGELLASSREVKDTKRKNKYRGKVLTSPLYSSIPLLEARS
jgi:hypothetical protein